MSQTRWFTITRAALILGIFAALLFVIGGLPGSVAAAATIYVDGVDGLDSNDGTQANPYKTIKWAVDHAASGDTIQVAAGTYPELIVLNKSVVIIGAGPSLSIIQAPNGSTSTTAVVTVTGGITSAEISGFTITRPATSGTVGYGILVRDGAYANIHDNSILDIRDQPVGGAQHGNGIQVGRQAFSTTGTATITNNVISGYQKTGIVVDNVGSNANITGNTITGDGHITYIAENGIQISRGATATVTGNTVSGHSYTPSSDTSGGILIFEAGATTITDNKLINNEIGISFADFAGGNGNGPSTIGGNEISATSSGTGSPYFWGIWVSDAVTNAMEVVITGNTFSSDNSAEGTAVGAAAGYGPFAIDLNVNTNVISNWFYGITLECNTTCGAGFSSLVVNNNSIVGNTNGVVNTTGVTVTTENNWWGNSSGPSGQGTGTGDSVSVNVDYDPWLTTSPQPTNVNLTAPSNLICGSGASLTIDFSNVPNLYGYQFKVSYDATKADVSSAAFVNGWFDTTDAVKAWPATCTGGTCWFAASFVEDEDPQTPPVLPVSGGGPVATINFTPEAPGTFDATISGIILTDVDGFSIPYSSDAASVSFDVCGQASVSGKVELQGRLTPMDAGQVKLIDMGDNFDDIIVPFDANTGIFTAPNVPVMPNGSDYLMQATHILYVGTAKSLVDLDPGEVITNQNTRLWGGDADNSGLTTPTGIDISDISCISDAFGGAPTGCLADPQSSTDINKDLVTNIQDLALAGGNYGKNPYQSW